ncbi:MAG: ROK family protein [Thermoleophilaceae bacterium]
MSPVTVGVDVGGTKVAAAAVDGTNALDRIERPTDLSSSGAVVEQIEACAREALSRAPEAEAVGIGVPSQIDFATGEVIASVNIPLAGVRLREELERKLKLPVFVDNDGNCAALAELHMLDDSSTRHLVMLTLGTGVGGGVVIDRHIFRGASGRGAELGHLVVQADGPECPGACPNRGCLEAYCSGLALERDATALGVEQPESALGRLVEDSGRCRGHEAVELARKGDPEAVQLLQRLGTYLGVGMTSLMNAFEPEIIVVGGGLGQAADLFLDRAIEEAKSRVLPAIEPRVRIERARGGKDAGLIGAGLLAAEEHARAAGHTPGETIKEGAL